MNIIFIGPPGSGKGTQSDILESKLSIKKISTGDILRNEVKKSTLLGKQVKSAIDKGVLISDEIMISIISDALDSNLYQEGFILDGFPRTLPQGIALSEMFKEKKIKLDAVIELKVDQELLADRIVGRLTCVDCGASYNIKFNNTKIPNTCDKCYSTNIKQRNDDNVETLFKRVKTFNEQSVELLNYYKSLNLLSIVDGMKSVNEVTEDIDIILNL